MNRVLVINPNMSRSVTDRVLAGCRQAQPQVTWDGVTARLGAAYIASESAYAIAAHAALDAYAAFDAGHDAILLACFGDPGLLALREVAAVPVVGLAEASFVAAAQRGPFAVVTGGHAWRAMLERFARAYRLDAQLVGIHTVELTGAQIAAAPELALDGLAQACQLGVAAGAASIVLGGAALAGLAAQLQARVPVPILDNVTLGAQAAAQAAAAPRARPHEASGAFGAVAGLSAELSARLQEA